MRFYKGIDLDLLQVVISGMKRRQPIYKLLKDELKLQGHWKDKPRGRSRKNFNAFPTA